MRAGRLRIDAEESAGADRRAGLGRVWAPSLSYFRGRFWLVYSVLRTVGGRHKDLDNYLVTAPAVAGPWSDPVYLNSSGFDQSFFHDDDGRHYLLNVRWDRTGRHPFGGILLQEYDEGSSGWSARRR